MDRFVARKYLYLCTDHHRSFLWGSSGQGGGWVSQAGPLRVAPHEALQVGPNPSADHSSRHRHPQRRACFASAAQRYPIRYLNKEGFTDWQWVLLSSDGFSLVVQPMTLGKLRYSLLYSCCLCIVRDVQTVHRCWLRESAIVLINIEHVPEGRLQCHRRVLSCMPAIWCRHTGADNCGMHLWQHADAAPDLHDVPAPCSRLRPGSWVHSPVPGGLVPPFVEPGLFAALLSRLS